MQFTIYLIISIIIILGCMIIMSLMKMAALQEQKMEYDYINFLNQVNYQTEIKKGEKE